MLSLNWRYLIKAGQRHLRRGDMVVDASAALFIALLAIPQALALAALAGLPPEYGIYSASFPVIVAALWGRIPYLVAGPDTAVALLIGVTLAQFASSGEAAYLQLSLLLTLMIGAIQLTVTLGRFGRLLDLISSTVVSGLTAAVALSILLASLPVGLGMQAGAYDLFSLVDRFFAMGKGADASSALIFAVTVCSGLVIRYFSKRLAILGAFAIGCLFALALRSWGAEAWNARIGFLDSFSLGLLPLSNPLASLPAADQLAPLFTGAVSIALLGLVQTTVLARSLQNHGGGEPVSTDREILAQGVSNLVAPFLSGFAGSGSFNRSAVLHGLAPRSRLAPALSGVFLLAIAWGGQALISLIAIPVIAGVLTLTAIGLFSIINARQFAGQRQELLIFWVTLVSALLIGLNEGVLIGVATSILVYFWLTSWPRIHVEEMITADGVPMHHVSIDGNLFFGSLPAVEKALRHWRTRDGKPSTLVVSLDHVTYLDLPAARMLLAEGLRRRAEGGGFYVVVDRETLLPPLHRSGITHQLGDEVLVNPFEPHPLKDRLLPFHVSQDMDGEAPDARLWANVPDGIPLPAYPAAMEALQERLRSSRLFAVLGREQLEKLLVAMSVRVAAPWQPIDCNDSRQIVILLHGSLEMIGQRPGNSRYAFRRIIRTGDRQGIVLASALHAWSANLHARTETRYITLEQAMLDAALAGVSMSGAFGKAELHDNAFTFSFLDVLPSDVRNKAESLFKRVTVKAGDFIIRQGDPGDSFYVLLEGEADVLKKNLFDTSVAHVASLSAGDSFGEESLLSGLTRNADIRMITDGELLRLDKEDFDRVVRPEMAPGITLNQARRAIREQGARWIDCRFEPEFESTHLEQAIHLSSDEIRLRVGSLEADRMYIVYCDTGRRSAAATFLLRERNINAFQLTGGLEAYPAVDLPYAVG